VKEYKSYVENSLIKSFLNEIEKYEYIWKDEWTSAVHFIRFLWKERFNEAEIVCGEFDCWPKRFIEFLDKRNSKYK
jgi:hypothetical protein